MGTQLPPKRGTALKFRPMYVMAKRMDELGCHLVWRYASAQATLCYMRNQHCKKGTQSPKFSAHIYCGQTARCIRIPIGAEVRISPRDIVLDGDPSPPKRGTSPNVWPMSLWPNGSMDQDATCYGGRSRPRRHSVRWRPSAQAASPKRGHSPTPNCRSMSLVAKRSPISTTAEFLLKVRIFDGR